MSIQWSKLAVVVAALIAATGCGDRGRAYVTGTVKLNGKPVGAGTISLEPIAGGPGAHALFAEDGKYKVTSSGKKDGAKVGEYKVAIVGGDNVDETADPKARAVIPSKYSNSTTSNLTLTVEPGTKEFDFDLQP